MPLVLFGKLKQEMDKEVAGGGGVCFSLSAWEGRFRGVFLWFWWVGRKGDSGSVNDLCGNFQILTAVQLDQSLNLPWHPESK